jgi:hypothetical protein
LRDHRSELEASYRSGREHWQGRRLTDVQSQKSTDVGDAKTRVPLSRPPPARGTEAACLAAAAGAARGNAPVGQGYQRHSLPGSVGWMGHTG